MKELIMTVLKYYEMHKPFLEALKDGKEHKLKEIKPVVREYFNLTEEDVKERLVDQRYKIL